MNRTLSRTGSLRVHESREGLSVIADQTPAAFNGFFKVGLAGKNKASVRPGQIERRYPMIGKVPLDGIVDGKSVRVPSLDMSDGPNDELRSWVGVRVRVDLDSGFLLQDPEALIIDHVNDLTGLWENGFSLDDGEGNGFLPLAMIVWRSETTAVRVIQDRYFNQSHTFRESDTPGLRGWHLFAPLI